MTHDTSPNQPRMAITEKAPSLASTVSDRLSTPHRRLPEWIKISPTRNPNYDRVKKLLSQGSLHTVCQEASCPNITECWGEGTATFMVLGTHCTRGCGFCDVITARPRPVDPEEPARLARVVSQLKLKQVVITMVTRDDLADGGASVLAETVTKLREQDPEVKIELLVSDFGGYTSSMETVLTAGVDVIGHNVETVGRLQASVRGKARLKTSLAMLRYADQYRPRPVVKTGFMVGLGETHDECVELMREIKAAGTDIVTIGQYLRPSQAHLPIDRFYHPEEFSRLAEIGRQIGFGHVEAGPLVRTSYKAFNQSRKLLDAK